MTILIVEDNAGVRRLLRHAVFEIASDIWECGDGADARTAYAAHWPDVVLMDIRMPRLDGLAATKQIREFNPSARVVMVTDYDEEVLRDAASEAGASGYVLKENLLNLAALICSLTGECE